MTNNQLCGFLCIIGMIGVTVGMIGIWLGWVPGIIVTIGNAALATIGTLNID